VARGDGPAAVPDGLLVTDVSVVHPASQTYATEAAWVTGAAAARRDANKMAKYPSSADGGVYDFVPINIMTDGKLSKAAMRLLGKLGDLAADGWNVSKAGVVLVAQVRCANGQGQWNAAHGGRPGLARVCSLVCCSLVATSIDASLRIGRPASLIFSRAASCKCVVMVENSTRAAVFYSMNGTARLLKCTSMLCLGCIWILKQPALHLLPAPLGILATKHDVQSPQ
jgi:hypothetical protein